MDQQNYESNSDYLTRLVDAMAARRRWEEPDNFMSTNEDRARPKDHDAFMADYYRSRADELRRQQDMMNYQIPAESAYPSGGFKLGADDGQRGINPGGPVHRDFSESSRWNPPDSSPMAPQVPYAPSGPEPYVPKSAAPRAPAYDPSNIGPDGMMQPTAEGNRWLQGEQRPEPPQFPYSPDAPVSKDAKKRRRKTGDQKGQPVGERWEKIWSNQPPYYQQPLEVLDKPRRSPFNNW